VNGSRTTAAPRDKDALGGLVTRLAHHERLDLLTARSGYFEVPIHLGRRKQAGIPASEVRPTFPAVNERVTQVCGSALNASLARSTMQ
jgi:hypothetical protein